MSTEWNAGYVTDVNYTSGYYGELNPLRCRLPLLISGRHVPRIENACELGFGQGVSVSIHAAAQANINWYGTDFNPSQAAFASDMVRLAGADAKLYDESFAEFCGRQDLPDFEFICLHGIWTWISNDNRTVLVDFIRRKLRPGGVLYISYNTLPGWAATAPVRHLMKRHAALMGASGHGIMGQADAALGFIDQVLALDPQYAKINPVVTQRVEQIKGQNRTYVAHEYMNRDWEPMYFADMEAWLSEAKVGFASSAHALDNIAELNLTPSQIEFMKGLPDASMRETIRDYCVNQQFRRDYWIRGVRGMAGIEQVTAIREERIVLAVPKNALPTKVNGVVGEAALMDSIYLPIFEILGDYKPHTVQEVEAFVVTKGVTFLQLSAALSILLGLSAIQPAAQSADVAKAKPRTLALNKAIARRSMGAGEIGAFASPVTGGGIPASRFQQLFWLNKQNGGKTPDDWAAYVYQLLRMQSQTIIKDGGKLQGEENLVELKRQAADWAEHTLPLWTALGI